jgi:serine/threonine-protein kinase RsbW
MFNGDRHPGRFCRDADLSKEYRAAYTNDIRNVALARRGISAFAMECGFSVEEVSDIRLAAGEALSNAFEHASAHARRKISVSCTFDGRQLTIEIRDRGPGFTQPLVQSTVIPDDRGRGFGIFLMRRLMDEVSFEHNGTVVRLVRRRP